MTVQLSKVVQTILVCLLLISCDRSENSPVSGGITGSNAISVENATIRATPPGQSVTAMFMKMTNSSSSDIELVKIQSDISKYAELHLNSNENGIMQMRQVEKIAIPATSTTLLETGGYHIMLIDLKKSLSPGTKVNVELIFNDNSVLSIQPEIRKY